MKKSPRRLPELEPLESVVLLSTFSQPEPARAVRTSAIVGAFGPTAPSVTIHVSGTQSQASLVRGQSGPAYLVAMGPGDLAGIGQTKFFYRSSPVFPGSVVGAPARPSQPAPASPIKITGAVGSPPSSYHPANGGVSIVHMASPTGTSPVTQTASLVGKLAGTVKRS